MKAISDFRPLVHLVAALGAILSLAAGVATPVPAASEKEGGVRPPVWAGSFYPADSAALSALMGRLTAAASATAVALPAERPLCALIMPHAGYAYSGLTAAHAALALQGRRYPTVIVLAPDHRVGLRRNAVSAVSAYRTPLGQVTVSARAAGLRGREDLFTASAASDAVEHGVEVVLPFLQQHLRGFELIPVVMGRTSPEANAAALDPLIDTGTLLVVSSDLSHFLPYEQAVQRDRETLRAIVDLDSDFLTSGDNVACGITPIRTIVELARAHRWQPVLLHYSNSGDTGGDRMRVVGYCAIAFLGGTNVKETVNRENRLSQLQGRALIALARETIARELGRPPTGEDDRQLRDTLADELLQRRCGTFVTLKIGDRLRGCIGSLDSRESIVEGVRRNALNAAFRDPRFSRLTLEELERTDIEVSVLTPPRPLAYTDAQDLVSKLRVNVDGLIIRKGGASATFLPQVWEQLPDAESFLGHLCMKAGLAADAWRRGGLEVETYQVQYFEEHR